MVLFQRTARLSGHLGKFSCLCLALFFCQEAFFNSVFTLEKRFVKKRLGGVETDQIFAEFFAQRVLPVIWGHCTTYCHPAGFIYPAFNHNGRGCPSAGLDSLSTNFHYCRDRNFFRQSNIGVFLASNVVLCPRHFLCLLAIRKKTNQRNVFD